MKRNPSHIEGEIIHIYPHSHTGKYILIIQLRKAVNYGYMERPLSPASKWIESATEDRETIAIEYKNRYNMKLKVGDFISGPAWYSSAGKKCKVFKDWDIRRVDEKLNTRPDSSDLTR